MNCVANNQPRDQTIHVNTVISVRALLRPCEEGPYTPF